MLYSNLFTRHSRSTLILLISISLSLCMQGQSTHPTDLIKVIKEQQSRYVRESCNQWACCCFTASDLEQFKQSDYWRTAIDNLRSVAAFSAIVTGIRKLPSAEWQSLRRKAILTRKPTWAEQGKISCTGQTDAGREAEVLVAQAVVKLVSEMLVQ